MKATIFKKKVTPRNGNKPFNKYVTTLVKKTGDKVYCDVMFEDGVTIPATFPAVVTIEKTDANLSTRVNTYVDDDGNEKEFTRNTLWVKKIKKVEPFVDTSLDDFE